MLKNVKKNTKKFMKPYLFPEADIINENTLLCENLIRNTFVDDILVFREIIKKNEENINLLRSIDNMDFEHPFGLINRKWGCYKEYVNFIAFVLAQWYIYRFPKNEGLGSFPADFFIEMKISEFLEKIDNLIERSKRKWKLLDASTLSIIFSIYWQQKSMTDEIINIQNMLNEEIKSDPHNFDDTYDYLLKEKDYLTREKLEEEKSHVAKKILEKRKMKKKSFNEKFDNILDFMDYYPYNNELVKKKVYY